MESLCNKVLKDVIITSFAKVIHCINLFFRKYFNYSSGLISNRSFISNSIYSNTDIKGGIGIDWCLCDEMDTLDFRYYVCMYKHWHYLRGCLLSWTVNCKYNFEKEKINKSRANHIEWCRAAITNLFKLDSYSSRMATGLLHSYIDINNTLLN